MRFQGGGYLLRVVYSFNRAVSSASERRYWWKNIRALSEETVAKDEGIPGLRVRPVSLRWAAEGHILIVDREAVPK
jgi:hypothetical protein